MDEEAPSGGSNTSKKSKGGNSEVGVPGNGSLALISKILENAMQDASTDPGKETAHKRRGAAGEQEEEGKDDEEEGKESDMEEKGNDDELLQGEQGQRTVRGRSIAAEALDVGREEDDRMSQERGDEEVKEEKSESFGVGATTVHGPSADKDASECSPSLSTVEEFVEVDLSDIRKDVQCPICLGIIRKTRTVMECLHRFCRECIDKSMRLGNNECPVCRTHCASRRSLRADLNFDALIAALYPNVDSYEEEEFSLHEENERQNKKLQQSIAETLERQSDAITRRCSTSKVAAANVARKSQTKSRAAESQNKGKTSQSYRGDDEDYAEECDETVVPEATTRERRTRRRRREHATVQLEPSDDEQGDVQANKSLRSTTGKTIDEAKGETSSGNIGRLEGFTTWARSGSRSTARFGNLNSSSNRLVARATMLLEALSAATQAEREIEFDVHVILQPFASDDCYDKLPSLDKPYICCPANVTVQHVCEFLIRRLPLDPDEDLELILGSNEGQDLFTDNKSNQSKQRGIYDNEGFKVPEILHPQATLGQIHEILWHCHGNLVLLYRRRI